MSQGIENSTELAKTHTTSSKFTDVLSEIRVLGREGNGTHKRDA